MSDQKDSYITYSFCLFFLRNIQKKRKTYSPKFVLDIIHILQFVILW